MALGRFFEFRTAEGKWYRQWLLSGDFEAQPTGERARFSMVIPPPNITGSLHMGHALNNTLQDILCRYKRMDGYNVLWIPGTDHAGIATQNVVERQMAEEGIDRHQIGRERFIDRVWKWREESGQTIALQLRRLGVSCDWSRERFTMDQGLSLAVRNAFVGLYHEGLVYRDRYLINWCPRCRTALADLEVELVSCPGYLYHLRYPFSDGSGAITVATTRPETLLGDTAVAVHPDDPRYRHLVGRFLKLPETDREIPILADEQVKPEFGSGAVKVTPAHDFSDFELGRRHGLNQVCVMDETGRMNREAGPYAGFDRSECRGKILESLQREGLLGKVEDYTVTLGHCYRCKTIVEPLLSDQWFVRTGPLAADAIKAVKEGRTRIFPQSWEKTYYQWLENIRDWCISRQIWWGHRIPAWHCNDCGGISVGVTDPANCNHCQGKNIVQDPDVLDTWFSSALWPFSTLGWPEKSEALRKFYPTSVLVTGFDILFFWVARMMMMGLKFCGDVPFRHVYIHALVRDEEGQKMSKSRGNVIDPLAVIDRYGTDALRFTLAAFAAMGRDIKLSEERIGGYQNFVNKLWNAARFVLMQVQDGAGLKSLPTSLRAEETLELYQAWILSRLQRTISDARQGLESYRFNDVASGLYQFVWHEFCDWAIELSKRALQEGTQASKVQTRSLLLHLLETVLRLLHPVMPFVTEEIWQEIPATKASLVVAPYPKADERWLSEEAERTMELVIGVIRHVRNVRRALGLSPKITLPLILTGEPEILGTLKRHESYMTLLGRVQSVHYQGKEERSPGVATQLMDGVQVCVPLEGAMDLNAERERLSREMVRLRADIERAQKRLGNPDFLNRAKSEIVEKEKEKAQNLLDKERLLQESLKLLDLGNE
jgi:valyl-tRNA synthetase